MSTQQPSNATDLGSGSVGKLMLKLALPTTVSQLVNLLYNIVDRIYIGNIPDEGVMALTGLGLCFPIIMIVSAFSSLFGTGGAPLAAIAMGKGDHAKAERILGNCTSTLLATSVVLCIILQIFGRDLLYLFGASENTIGYAYAYLSIYAFGTIFVQIALGLNMFITTQGFAKISMMTVLIGAIINIILDPILIFGFNMGVQGAALATITSQAVSAIWVLRFLTGKKTTLRIRKQTLRPSMAIMSPVLALGMAPFIMASTESILNVCFNASLSHYGGDLAVGSMTILTSIMMLCTMPLQGLTQGAQPIISFNYGAGKIDRVKQAVTFQIGICFGFAFVMWVLTRLFPQMFVSIFSDDAALIEYAVWALKIYMFGTFSLGIQYPCQQTFVAMGYAKISLFIACLRKIILLIPMILILPYFFEDKVFAVFAAEPIADITSALVTAITFVFVMRHVMQKDKIV